MSAIELLALASGFAQALGYTLYIRLSLRHDIDPNPTSWLMFAYGTALLVALEYATGASWRELLLPSVCATASLVVAGLCLRRGTLRWPRDPIEVGSFIADLAITVVYVGVWIASSADTMEPDVANAIEIALVACVVASTVTSFIPILYSTYHAPQHERPSPWAVWSLAYALLLATTVIGREGGQAYHLLLYPTASIVLHAAVGLLALRRRADPPGLFTDRTERTGWGLFTERPVARHELAFVLTGVCLRFASRTPEDAMRYPNWYGVSKDHWVKPDRVFRYLNHSCAPNLGIRGQLEFVALRDIPAGEELTFDYAITEDEAHWHMKCACGELACRGVIGNIASTRPDILEAYEPFIPPHFQHAYLSGPVRMDAHVPPRHDERPLEMSMPTLDIP